MHAPKLDFMVDRPVPWNAGIDAYEGQAAALMAAHGAALPAALDVIHASHPRFLDATVPWIRQPLTPQEIAAAPFSIDDARLTVARAYSYLDWPSLLEHVAAVADTNSPVHRFEAAVQATIDGALDSLRTLLDADPSLPRARSVRRTHFDPPVHGATLLHYVAANGVEQVNQRTPPNAVALVELLLERGADPNATAALYGGQCTVLSMLVSSAHPASQHVQLPLIDLLVACGASVESRGAGAWTSPLGTALVFGYVDAAEALVRHGAPWQQLDLAAGLGRAASVRELLPHASAEQRHRALALAAQLGRAEIVGLLLDAGEDPNRFNPAGMHAHATPLHHAALGGHAETVQVLLKRGARLDMRDTTWQGTPDGWAAHGGHADLAEWLAMKANTP
jgi:ankyrin repeat protein